MDVELLLVTQFDRDRDLRGVGDDLRRQVELAREGGFDGVGVSEHHATDAHQYLLNEPVMAHIADALGDMRLTSALCLLPYHNPLRIAELGATLDVLTNGRFRLGVGIGYRRAEYDAFDVDRSAGPGRLAEGVGVVERLWQEDAVTFTGDHFSFEGATIRPKPLQSPRPPIWVGASNPSSVRRGARIADGFLGGHVPLDVASDQIAAFRAERDRTDRGPGEVALFREAYVADTTAAAAAVAKEPLLRKYDSYTDWGQEDVIGGDSFAAAWTDLAEDRFLVGAPAEVAAEIERYQTALDLDSLFLRTQFPGMDPADVRSSIRLIGDEVVPALD